MGPRGSDPESRGQNWLQSSDSRFPGPKVQKHPTFFLKSAINSTKEPQFYLTKITVWHDNISWIFHLISKENSYSLNLVPLHISSHSLPPTVEKEKTHSDCQQRHKYPASALRSTTSHGPHQRTVFVQLSTPSAAALWGIFRSACVGLKPPSFNVNRSKLHLLMKTRRWG